jgi:hypothetical protein
MPTDTALALEQALRARRAPALLPDSLAGEFVLPDYAGHSLANIAATVGALLGTPDLGVAPPLDLAYWGDLATGVQRVVLVLLDALGYLQLQQMLAREPQGVWASLAARGTLLPMTSVFPSTTDTALATVFTGCEPLAHGLLGYEMWLREYGVLAEMLSLKPAFGNGDSLLLDWGLQPESFLPVPGLGALLASHGVHTTALVPAPFTRGALTRMCYRGFDRLLGYTGVDNLWAIARHLLARDEPERSLYFLYWGGIDSAIHTHGSAGGRWVQQYQDVTRACAEQFLGQLTARECEGTLFVLVADHGFVDTPEALAHDTEVDPAFRRHLLVPYSGEARAAYLHCFAGEDDGVLAELQEALGPHFFVRRTRDAVAAGLWGAGAAAPESAARLGHLVVMARGAHYLDRRNLRTKLRGRHGGLTPEEMLVPWLAVRLDG